jgi:hypothetical protein
MLGFGSILKGIMTIGFIVLVVFGAVGTIFFILGNRMLHRTLFNEEEFESAAPNRIKRRNP